MRIVVKIGGAQLEQPDGRSQLATAVRAALDAGHQVVMVHGGGNQIRSWTHRMGLPERTHEGLRCTDADTAEVVTAVLGGLVNKQLVQALGHGGVPAAGITGADGASFAADVHRPGGHDLGFVGEVREVDTTLLGQLLDGGHVPVIATIAPLSPDAEGDRSRLYNINADMAAGPLAGSLDADALLFLTDVPGVLDADHRLVSRLAAGDAEQLQASGALEGGIRPKVGAALAAAESRPDMLVKIAPGRGANAVLEALAPDAGTLVCATAQGTGHG